MKYTMAVFSLGVPGVSEWRYDVITTAGNLAYYRLQTPEKRSRWKLGQLADVTTPSETIITAGPVLVEVTPEEAQEIENRAAHPPRNLGLRSEKVRTEQNDPPLSIDYLNEWLAEWRNATATGDYFWVSARTHRHGRVRGGRPFPSPVTAVTEGSSAVTATSGENPPEITAAVNKSWAYPELIRGWVTRPNGQRYRVRKVGKHHDVIVFRKMRERGAHCLTTGVPGTGKSALMEAAFGDQMITVLGTEDLEAADLQGSYVESDSGLWLWADGPLIICMEKGLVLYLDEIGVVRAKQMAQLYSVMDGRNQLLVTANPKRGVIKAAPGFMIAASTNPESPEVRMTDAVMNRFAFKMQIDTDYKMAATQFGIPEWLTGAAENLELRRRSREIPWAPQTRDLILWKENAETLDDEHLALGSMVNSAPVPAQAVVADVLSKACGKKIKPLVLV